MDFKSQLLIIGNGFDKQCKLKSSYDDFFRGEILDTNHLDNCGITRMRPECSGFWETLLFKYYEKYGDKDYKWCDVEEIIKNTLLYICYGKEYSTYQNIQSGLWRNALSRVYNGLDPIDMQSRKKDKVIDYLLEYCTRFFYNCPIKNNDFKIEKLHLLVNNILQELNNFENRFCKFIRDQIINPNDENEFNDEYLANAVNLLAKIADLPDTNIKKDYLSLMRDGYADKNKLKAKLEGLKNVNVLSFNYTALFDFLELESPCAYSNVHGKLCNKQCKSCCKDSNIIFGIDDTFVQSQKGMYELRPFSKTYRKMNDTSSPKSILPNREIKPIAIKFYGHSLSEADYSYFQSIFDYYDIYDNNGVSLIFCYSKGYEQIEAIYKLINSYGKTLANLNQGKNLIHKLLLENRLKIVEIK